MFLEIPYEVLRTLKFNKRTLSLVTKTKPPTSLLKLERLILWKSWFFLERMSLQWSDKEHKVVYHTERSKTDKGTEVCIKTDVWGYVGIACYLFMSVRISKRGSEGKKKALWVVWTALKSLIYFPGTTAQPLWHCVECSFVLKYEIQTHPDSLHQEL